MDIFKIAEDEKSFLSETIAGFLEEALKDWETRKDAVKNALTIPPDFTRFHSSAGFITQVFCRLLTAKGATSTSCRRSGRTCRSPRRSGRRCLATFRMRR